jgi:hypothetical protein
MVVADQGGDLVSDTASAFLDHLRIAEGLSDSDHGLALSRGQDKQGGMAFGVGIIRTGSNVARRAPAKRPKERQTPLL